MTTKQLKARGFALLAKSPFENKPYTVQHSHTNRSITLHVGTGAEHGTKYFQAVDREGNILLIRQENLSYNGRAARTGPTKPVSRVYSGHGKMT